MTGLTQLIRLAGPSGRLVAAGAVCLLLLATTSCGGSGSGSHRAAATPSALTLLPQKLDRPAESAADPSPSPAADAPFADNLEYALRRKTQDMAGYPGITSADCPKDVGTASGATAVCTVRYDDLAVVWDVVIGQKAAWSDSYVTFTARPRQGLVTSAGVARLMYGNDRSADEVRCNDLPRAVLVPLGSTTPYVCQTVTRGVPGAHEQVNATDSGPLVF